MAARKARSKSTQPSFEERLSALEGVVRALEGEELPLEESLERYRTGVEHLRACRAMLDDAEARLAELVRDEKVVPSETPLKLGDEGLRPFDDDEG